MSTTLILFVMVIYVGVAMSEARAGNVGMAIAFLGYALGNVGLALVTYLSRTP